MTFVDRSQSNSRRSQAIVAVAAIHALIGYGLISGLTVADFIPVQRPPLQGQQIPLPPPPPEPEPEPQPSPSSSVENPVAPIPPLPIPSSGPIVVDTFDPTDVPKAIDPLPVPRPSPGIGKPSPSPKPSATITPKSAVPKNGPQGWITTEDYPARPLRQGAEGTARYRVVVGTDGRVNACEITTSSGNGGLDEATCKLISRRARFEPATNDQGTQVVGTYSGTVTWQIPK